MEPACTPYFVSSAAIVLAELIPSGQSQSTCNAIVGQTPVTRCTCPASLNFSSVVAAAAGCKNLPKRVPVLANPQDGISMRNSSSDRKTVSEPRALMPFNLSQGDYTSPRMAVTPFLRGN